MRSILLVFALVALCACFFPQDAMADHCRSGICLRAVAAAPVRLASAIRNRERKPVVRGVKWLFRR